MGTGQLRVVAGAMHETWDNGETWEVVAAQGGGGRCLASANWGMGDRHLVVGSAGADVVEEGVSVSDAPASLIGVPPLVFAPGGFVLAESTTLSLAEPNDDGTVYTVTTSIPMDGTMDRIVRDGRLPMIYVAGEPTMKVTGNMQWQAAIDPKPAQSLGYGSLETITIDKQCIHTSDPVTLESGGAVPSNLCQRVRWLLESVGMLVTTAPL